MDPEIKKIKGKKLVGMTMEMSFEDDKTQELWKTFMPWRNEIKRTLNNDLISLQIYEPGFFNSLDPALKIRKWALREVSEFNDVPDDMVSFYLEAGEYAVFIYKGLPAQAQSFFNHIFKEWLPNSDYQLDDRPHFEVLGPKYSKNSPDSEEEVWIPVKRK